MTRLRRSAALALAAVAGLASLAHGQEPAASDTLNLTLGRALEIGQERNPVVQQAGYRRAAAGSGVLSAYGTLLPRVGLQGQAQRSGEGSFTIFGVEFQSPQSYTTLYQWDFTHSLLDAGRDLFRIRSARALADRAIATYDLEWWQVRGDVQRQYIEARRGEALVAQAELELDRRAQHLQLAEARHEVGAVTRSDILQAQLSVNQGEVERLRAGQRAEEARLALRRLLGGELPDVPLRLATDFEVFPPGWEEDALVARALEIHPSLREAEAQEDADAAGLWIARSRYLPGLNFQYSLSRTVTDSAGFEFSGFDRRSFFALSLNWELFDGFVRHNQVSEASATLNTTRAEQRRRALTLEETVRAAYTRLVTAYAAYRANTTSVELAREDLRLGEGRYETGAGSFVDLLDARVRAAQAETDLIGSIYDFYLALVELEQGTGLQHLPESVLR